MRAHAIVAVLAVVVGGKRGEEERHHMYIYIHIVYMYTGLGGWPLKTDLSD